MILADIAAPSVVVGASLLGFFVYLGVSRGFGTILIAHVAFNVAFVVVVLQSRLRDLDPALAEAARDLGANSWQAFWQIVLPVISPGDPRPPRCSPRPSRSTTSSSPASSPARR